MAANSTTERTIKTRLDAEGSASVRREARAAERELKRLQRVAEQDQARFVRQTTAGADKLIGVFGGLTKGIFAVGSAAGSAKGLAGATAAVASLSGTLLALPGVALTTGAAVGVAALAMHGFSDAIAAEDAKEWTEATKDMAPAAIEAARAIRDQRDRLIELKKTVQGRFFAGFSDDVRGLADRYFPILNKQGGEIAGEFAAMRREAAKALLDPQTVDAVNKVLGSTKNTVHELTPAVGNVLRAVLKLGGVGAERTEDLGRAVSDVTKRFEKWVDEGLKTGKINKLIDEGVETAKDFGRVFQNIGQITDTVFDGLDTGGANFLDRMIKSTQAVEDFFKSADGQEVLRELGLTLSTVAEVASRVFTTAMREAGPVLRELLPVVRETATAVGDVLVDALEIAGPIAKGLAGFLSDNKEVVGDLVPLVLGLAVAYKGLQVAQNVKTWMSAIPGVFDDIGKKANTSSDTIVDGKGGRGLSGRLLALKAIGAVFVLGTVGAVLSNVGDDAEASAGKLNAMETALRGVGDGINSLLNFDIEGAMKNAETVQTRLLLKLAELRSGIKTGNLLRLEISVGANTLDAQIELKRLQSFVNKTSGTVDINGNSMPAATALKTVVDAISRGEGTVTLNGNQAPAEATLRYLIDVINAESGTVRFNGNDRPAGEVLAELLRRTDLSSANIKVGADTSGAQGVIDSFIRLNNGKTVQIYTSVLGSGGIASAGRLAGGGRPFFSGPVVGPGSGTSDTAGLFALSDGEHVLRAAEVRAAGGHAAIFAMRRRLMRGAVKGLASGGVPAYLSRPVPSSTAAPINVTAMSGATEVRVFIGEQEITDVVDTRIEEKKRQDRRSATAGPGGAW